MPTRERPSEPTSVNGPVSLREATLDDARLIFEWRNLPEMIPLSKTQRRVDWAEHWQWFQNVVTSKDHLLLIVLLQQNPIGQIRFDRLSGRVWEVSILVVPQYTGRGLGVDALKLACEKIYTLGAEEIVAIVRSDNRRSVRAFQKAGFRLDEGSSAEVPPDHVALLARLSESKI
jgi:RimJ/RimL family protein N-acetyltransferase